MAIANQLALVYSYTTRNTGHGRNDRLFNAVDINLNDLQATPNERRALRHSPNLPAAIHYTDTDVLALYHTTGGNHRGIDMVSLSTGRFVNGQALLRWPSRFVTGSDDGDFLFSLHYDIGEFDSDNIGQEGLIRLRKTSIGPAIARGTHNSRDIVATWSSFRRGLRNNNERRTFERNFIDTSYNATRIFIGGFYIYVWVFPYERDSATNTWSAFGDGTLYGMDARVSGTTPSLVNSPLSIRYPIRPNSSGNLSFTAGAGADLNAYYFANNNAIVRRLGLESGGGRVRATTIVPFTDAFPFTSRNDLKLAAADGVVFAMAEGSNAIKRWDSEGNNAKSVTINHGADTRLVDFRIYRGPGIIIDPTTNLDTIMDGDTGGIGVGDDDDVVDDDPPVSVTEPDPGSLQIGAPRFVEPASTSSELSIDRSLILRLNTVPSDNITSVDSIIIQRRLYDTEGSNHGPLQHLRGTPGSQAGEINNPIWSRGAWAITNRPVSGPFWSPTLITGSDFYIVIPNWFESAGETYEFKVAFRGRGATDTASSRSANSLPVRVKALDPPPPAPTITEPRSSTPPQKRTPLSPLLLRWSGAEGTVEYVRIQRRIRGSSTIYSYYDGFTPLVTDGGGTSQYALGAHVDSNGDISVVSSYNIARYPNAVAQDPYRPVNNSFIPMWIDFSTYMPGSPLTSLQNNVRNSIQRNRTSSYLIPITHSSYNILWDAGGLRFDGWGLNGNIYEYRIAYKSVGERWSGYSDWRAVDCEEPAPDPPTIESPDGTVDYDPRNTQTFRVRIPSGQIATSIQLKRRHEDGREEYWSNDDTTGDVNAIEGRGWSSLSGARSVPADEYSGVYPITLDENWQDRGTTWSYSASYTTSSFPEFSLIGYGAEVDISTLSDEDLKQPPPMVIQPRNGISIAGEVGLQFQIRLPLGITASNFRIRRREKPTVGSVPSEHFTRTSYEYWGGSILHVLWTSDDTAVAHIEGEYTSEEDVRFTLRGGWQDPAQTWLYSVAYISDGEESRYTGDIEITTVDNHPSDPPFISAPDENTTHAPSSSLTLEISLPEGVASAEGVYIRRRLNSRSPWRWRNASNTGWQSGQPRRSLSAGSGNVFDVVLPPRWNEDPGDATGGRWDYEVSFVDSRNIQSFWSDPTTLFAQSVASSSGVVLYRTSASTNYEAIDFDNNEVTIGANEQSVYQLRGYPAFIHSDEAFYLTRTSQIIGVNLSSNLLRVAQTKETTASFVFGLTANEANTHAYAIEKYAEGGVDAYRLVEWDLPNFTTRRVVTSGTRNQAHSSRRSFLDGISAGSRIRYLAVSGSVSSGTAYFMYWAIPLHGSFHLFFAHSALAYSGSSTAPNRTFATRNNRRYFNNNNTVDVYSSIQASTPAINNVSRTVDGAFSVGSVTQELWIDASSDHLWAMEQLDDNSNALEISENRSLRRFDLPSGDNQQNYEFSGRLQSFQVYQPQGFVYTPPPSPAPAPTWDAPPNRHTASPQEALVLDVDRGGRSSTVAGVQRRIEGTSTWFGHGVDDLGQRTWIPNDRGRAGWLAGNTIRLEGGQWGEDGVNYDFRVSYLHEGLYSEWSTPRTILCRLPTVGAYEAPMISSPLSGLYPSDQQVEFNITGNIPTGRFYLYFARESDGLVEYFAAGRWHTIEFVFSTADYMAADGLSASVVLEGDNHQPEDSTYDYYCWFEHATTRQRSPNSDSVTLRTSGALGSGTEVEVEPVELNDRTPHAPTWST